jgi:hypothetical protein
MRYFQTILVVGILWPVLLTGQAAQFPFQRINLDDMSAWKPAAANWRIAGDASADMAVNEAMTAQPGKGVLVNLPTAKLRDNLVSVMEHGDIDLEVDVMMAAHSNSGIYLQGRYEVQVLDSWAKKRPYFGDMGGIYQRWDDSKPEALKGFEGNAPLLSVAKAPGLWQHFRIVFKAPRFDASGRKVANARIEQLWLNGALIHENLELTGPTRGPLAPNEVVKGPILLQGDHGPVAYRNFRYRAYEGDAVSLRNVKYTAYTWDKDGYPNFATMTGGTSGELPGLTWEVAASNNDFANRYTATLRVPESGIVNIKFDAFGGGLLKIGNDTLARPGSWSTTVSRNLPAGDHPVEIQYVKRESWYQPLLGLFAEGQKFRQVALHQASSAALDVPVAPIFVAPQGRRPELLRCFMDVQPDTSKPSIRIVHPINVGYPDGPAYTYDLDCGALVQVWRGRFLEATPMWENRGDGHANPIGSVTLLGVAPQFGPSGRITDTLPTDANYRFGNYTLDENGSPTYEYTMYGYNCSDKIMPSEDGKRLTRAFMAKGGTLQMEYRMAINQQITSVGKGLYIIGDKSYYIQVPAAVKATIRKTADGRQELVAPVGDSGIQYDVVW